MYKILKNKIKSKIYFFNKQEEVLGKLNLSFFQFNTYLPYSKSSLNYSSISYLLNDITINNRKNVIEFGGGISTVYLAKLAKSKKNELKIITIDHDKGWISILKEILEKEGVSDYVTLIHSPLVESEKSFENNKWYDEKIIIESIKGIEFDLVIVDGPLAFTRDIELSRYPALPFINNYLSERNAVFLDDTNRKGERKIIKEWEKKFKRFFNELNTSSMISIKGEHFNIS